MTMPPWLLIEEIEGVEPLDAQFGRWPKAALPDALRAPLFGQPAALPAEARAAGGAGHVAPLHSYAVLDAALVPQLPQFIEDSGLDHRCLYKGQAEDKLGAVAPWLVELTPDNDLLRRLFSRSPLPGHLWDVAPGLYLRSRQPLAKVWAHLRRFTQVQDTAGSWYYFRFWDAGVSARLLQLGNRPDIAPFVGPLFPETEARFEILTISPKGAARLSRRAGTRPPEGPWRLTPEVGTTMRLLRRELEFEKILDITWRNTERHLDIPRERFDAMLLARRDSFFELGLWRRDHLAKMCTWEAMLGPDFIDRYADGRVRDIVDRSQEAHDMIERIEHLLDTLAEQEDEPAT